MKIRLSAPARREFLAYIEYVSASNTRSARAERDRIVKALWMLAEHPRMGRVVWLRRRKRHARRWNVPPMAIYYDPRGADLYVLRILHGARRPITR